VAIAIALFFAFAQVQRTAILRDCQALRQLHVLYELPGEWQDSIWQRRPRKLTIVTTVHNGIVDEQLPLRNALDEMGYREVSYMAQMP
jgi:hypothetical protein